MTASEGRIEEIAAGLTEAQRGCGDLLDSLPCVVCGADCISKCPLPPSATYPARDLINATPGLHNYLLAEVAAVRTHLQEQSHD